MHFNFDFNAVQILWTLTFATHLILLVVLLGRDRIHRFQWFTAGVVMVTLRLLSSRLLYGRMPQITMSAIFIVMADISAAIALLVVVEMARRAFGGASRRAWMAWTVALLAGGGAVLATWGKWPAWKTIAFDTLLARLGLLQLAAQKVGLLVDVVTILLGLLVVLFGRRYGAGWRSHVQQILIGLSTASLGQLAVQAVWETIARTAVPHSMAEYQHVVNLRERLFNANSAIYVVVMVWWIVCLWIDEPGSGTAALEAGAGAVAESADVEPTEAPQQ